MKAVALLAALIIFQVFSGLISYSQDAGKHKIGDYAYGGIIFSLDESNQHGLVCAKEDQGTGIYYKDEINKTGNDGKIVKLNLASHLCEEYTVSQYGRAYDDWRLPTKEQLFLIYQLREIIEKVAKEHGGAGFLKNSGVSPTEYCNSPSWDQEFNYAYDDYDYMKIKINVRAVRSF